jgi:hypothetical protein
MICYYLGTLPMYSQHLAPFFVLVHIGTFIVTRLFLLSLFTNPAASIAQPSDYLYQKHHQPYYLLPAGGT